MLLNVQQIDRDGLNPTYGAASAGGDEYLNDSWTFLHIQNGSGAEVTVTIAQQARDNQGFEHDISVAIPAGEGRMIAASPAFYNNAQGRAEVSYSAVTSVTVAALRRKP